MSEANLVLDGVVRTFRPGQTLMEVADRAGVAIPRLCHHPDFRPHGSCRLCMVEVGGHWQPACATPAVAGMQVLSRTPALLALRRSLIALLLSHGNHFCPGCERSGDCRLQDCAQLLGVQASPYPQAASRLPLDASHPDVVFDPNRCILCGLCLRASREADGKEVFVIAGRGGEARLQANAPSGRLGDTALAATDRALAVCPVGALLPRGLGFAAANSGRQPEQGSPPHPAVVASVAAGGRRPRLATVSLAGCFGCHMSFLDLDEALLPLLAAVELTRSPLTDLRDFEDWDIGLVEGGVCNAENLETLRRFRQHCRVLVAVGACAINGGLPALRNGMDVQALLRETYLKGPGLAGPALPADPELPPLLPRVYPLHEVVKVDFSIPGCPPPAAALGHVLAALLAGREPDLPSGLIRYD